METTTLKRLRDEEVVTLEEGGLLVQVRPEWVVSGEDRVSYTTVVRLIECCREYHWSQDVISVLESGSTIDSITKALTADFRRPIPHTSLLRIRYRITDVRLRSYSLSFSVENESIDEPFAFVSMICVFWDPQLCKPVAIPDVVRRRLRTMLTKGDPIEQLSLDGAEGVDDGEY